MPDQKDIEALTQIYSDAVRAKDPERLATLYDADVRVFDTWGRRPLAGLTAWRTNLDGWLTSLSDDENVRVSFSDIQVSSRSDMGCLHALVTYSARDRTGQMLRSMENRLSWVVSRSKSGWTIVHEHTSVPIGPDLKGILQKEEARG